MKALELAKNVEHWVSCDAGIRGEECRAAAAELRRLAEVNAELLEALDFYGRYILKRAKDGQCMILTPIDHDCGDRARAAIAKAKEQ